MSIHEQFAEDLALYALGALDGQELQTIEKHVSECPSCRRELEMLRGDSSLLALTAAGPKPPARARERLLLAISKEASALEKAAAGTSATSSSVRRSWWPAFGGWLVAVALALVCMGLLRQSSSLQKNLAQQESSLQQELAALRSRLSGQETELQQASAIVTTLLDPQATKFELVAAGSKPQPRGKAIYERRTKNLIFLASSLPPLPPEKIYELWLFPANGGAPIPAGLFKPDARGSATVVNPPLPENVAAKTFAVTLEPESGSHESPRGTPVIAAAGE